MSKQQIELTKSTSLSNIVRLKSNSRENSVPQIMCSNLQNQSNLEENKSLNDDPKQTVHTSPNNSPGSSSCSSSSSSILATLSELSFSTTESTSVVSSSVSSYVDATLSRDASMENLSSNNKPSKKIAKSNKTSLQNISEQTSSSLLSSVSSQSIDYLNALELSQSLAPYFNKKFYGKEWLYSKLNNHVNKLNEDLLLSSINKNKQPNCLVLLGELGTGKTHLCCELKWATNSPCLYKSIAASNHNLFSDYICSIYFFDFLNKKQNYLRQFSLHLSRSILDLASNLFKENNFTNKHVRIDINDFESNQKDMMSVNAVDINKLATTFVDDILKPIQNFENLKNYFIVLDGLDDAILQSQLESMNNKDLNEENSVELILSFISKIFSHFPKWLNLIITSRRCNEKRFLRKYLKYEKISIDKCLNFTSLLINNKKLNNNGNQIIMNQSFSTSKSIHDKLQETFKSNNVSQSQSTHSLALLNDKKSSLELYNAANLANLKDLQIFILKRLDNDKILKSKFSNQTNSIEMLNLLLIKSNYCILYIEKVFDLIVNGIIRSNDIKDIPATLNGLYLYLIECILKKLNKINQEIDVKELLYTILGLSFIEFKPFDRTDLYSKLKFRFSKLEIASFEKIFDFIEPILFKKLNSSTLLTYFHSSLIEWLNDVKYCTPNYLINLSESHFIMSHFYFDKLIKQKRDDKSKQNKNLDYFWNAFKYHLFNSKKIQLINEQHLFYYYTLCKYEMEFNEINKTNSERKLTMIDLQLNDENNNRINMETCLFELLNKGDLMSLKLLISNDLMLKSILSTMTDSFNQNSLLIAVKLNNYELVDYLVHIKSIDLNHCDNMGWTALRYCSNCGNESLVKLLIENGVQIDLCDSDGRTALTAAVSSGHENVAKILIKNGANVNKLDKESRSILHFAVSVANLNIVKMLVLNGANVNHLDKFCQSILSACIFSNSHIDIIKYLVKHGAYLDIIETNNHTPLLKAAKENLAHVVELLVGLNADIDSIDAQGYTALTYAIKNKNNDLVEFLLRKNAATHILDIHGRSILSISASCNSEKVVKILTERGLDEMHRDNFGWTPLHESAFGGYLSIAQILLNYGSEIDACDNSGKTSLYYACQEGHLELVRLLLNRNANINLMSHDGITPFRIACVRNHLKLCEFLLKNYNHVIDIESADQDGRTILEILIEENKNLEIVELILKYGANPNILIDSNKTSLLHLATNNGNEKLIEILFKYKIEKDAQDKNGNTALMIACSKDKPNIVKSLLTKNVSLNLKNNLGETALKIASKNETNSNCDIIIELLKYSSIQMNNNAEQNIKTAISKLNLIEESKEVVTPLGFNRTSQSVDSFKSDANNKSSTITPSLSTYQSTYDFSNQTTDEKDYPNSITNSKFESVGNLSLKVNLPIKNESATFLTSSSASSSKFKLIKDKLLRKPSSVKMYQSSASINVIKRANTHNLKQSPSTTSESITSFLSSKFDNNNNKFEPRVISIETLNDDDQSISSNSMISLSNNSKKSSLKQKKLDQNKTFFNMLRNKLKTLTNRTLGSTKNLNTKDSTVNITNDFEINFQMHRSITDYNKMNELNKLRSSSSVIYANGTNEIIKSPTILNSQMVDDDDTAYIFNRNSLNVCLNSKFSSRNYLLNDENYFDDKNKIKNNKPSNKYLNNCSESMVMLPSKPKVLNIKTKRDTKDGANNDNKICRPTSLNLTNFKKESSI